MMALRINGDGVSENSTCSHPGVRQDPSLRALCLPRCTGEVGDAPSLGVLRSALCLLYQHKQIPELFRASSHEIRRLSWMSPNMSFKHPCGQEMETGGTLAKRKRKKEKERKGKKPHIFFWGNSQIFILVCTKYITTSNLRRHGYCC